jgi:hypothetical protein
MVIDRSTCSNAPARGGDKARETERSALVAGERGCSLLDCKGVSLSASEHVSASLRHSQWPSSRMMGGLTSPGKQRLRAPGGLGGVVVESAHRKRNRVIRETSPVFLCPRLGREQRGVGNHNYASGRSEESGGLVVARKRVKARGAKEPYCRHAGIETHQPFESLLSTNGIRRVPAKGRRSSVDRCFVKLRSSHRSQVSDRNGQSDFLVAV